MDNSRNQSVRSEIKKFTVLTAVDKQLNRWVEHFGELLNRPRPHNQPDMHTAS